MYPLLYIILCVSIVSASEQTDLTDRLYTGLNNVLDYIFENRYEINIDGLFGVVLAQAHLEDILNTNLNDYDRENIVSLNDKAHQIYEFIQSRSFEKSFERSLLNSILNPEIWKRRIVFKTNELNPQSWNYKFKTETGYINYLKGSNFSEVISDKCISELVTTKDSKCDTTKKCTNIMVDDKRYDPAYGITHRLLYLQIANALQCDIDQIWYGTKTNSYCSYILWEADKNANFGFISGIGDLLMEQITLCGYEGYGEFFKTAFIEYVLSSQTEHGCFNNKKIEEVGDNKIKKRSANVIKYGCVDHTTGLGASSMSLMLRYLLNDKL